MNISDVILIQNCRDLAEGIISIQLNPDSLYPFSCWSLCLLCWLILMLTTLMFILIESRSMLIVYWLCDRKLINAQHIMYYPSSTAMLLKVVKHFRNVAETFPKNVLFTWICMVLYITSKKIFWKDKMMFCKIYINLFK